MTGVEIRDVRPDELDEVGDVRLAAYQADGFLSPRSAYAQTLRSLGADGLGQVLVATFGEPAESVGSATDGAQRDCGRERIVGTVMLQCWPEGGEVLAGPQEAEVRALAVLPEA